VRDVRHVELSLAGSGLNYEPGDSIGVLPENPEATVAAVLAAARLDGSQAVERDGRQRPLAEWLTSGLEITRVTRPLLAKFAELGPHPGLAALLQPGREAELRALITEIRLADLLERYPAQWQAAALVATLRPLAPRLYSIASSAKEAAAAILFISGWSDSCDLPALAAPMAFLAKPFTQEDLMAALDRLSHAVQN
jgi:sulfite reductase (NADPH) flavoprotein alpha-component